MSREFLAPDPADGAGADGASANDPVRRRRSEQASVRVSGPDSGASEVFVDPASKSLGDALRITYRFLQISMIVILGLFLLSGFRQINATERGINLTFGKVVGSDLAPGFQFSWPAPIGELLKISVANEPLELKREFWLNLTETESIKITTDPNGVQSLAGGGSDAIDPDAEGMLLLGDGSIAHAQVKLTYVRKNAVKYATTIDPAFEQRIIASAVRRGVVQTVGRITLDEFMKNVLDSDLRGGDGRSVDNACLDASQAVLDQLDAGIQLQEFAILNRIPPRRVMPAFNRVLSATQDSQKARTDALAFRQERLVETAGEAADVLLELIDQYELDLASGKADAANETLALIDKVLLGEAKSVPKRDYVPPVTGQVTAILDDARQYRTTMTNKAQADLAVFNAKRDTFRSNPRVMVAGEWAGALSAFLSRPSVQTMILPPGSDRIVMSINRDPRLARKIEQDRNTMEYEQAERERNQRLERSRYQEKFDASTKTGEQ